MDAYVTTSRACTKSSMGCAHFAPRCNSNCDCLPAVKLEPTLNEVTGSCHHKLLRQGLCSPSASGSRHASPFCAHWALTFGKRRLLIADGGPPAPHMFTLWPSMTLARCASILRGWCPHISHGGHHSSTTHLECARIAERYCLCTCGWHGSLLPASVSWFQACWPPSRHGPVTSPNSFATRDSSSTADSFSSSSDSGLTPDMEDSCAAVGALTHS